MLYMTNISMASTNNNKKTKKQVLLSMQSKEQLVKCNPD